MVTEADLDILKRMVEAHATAVWQEFADKVGQWVAKPYKSLKAMFTAEQDVEMVNRIKALVEENEQMKREMELVVMKSDERMTNFMKPAKNVVLTTDLLTYNPAAEVFPITGEVAKLDDSVQQELLLKDEDLLIEEQLEIFQFVKMDGDGKDKIDAVRAIEKI